MRLLFKCQHVVDIDIEKSPSPVCWCGSRQVVRALNVRPPRIVGHALGPLVEGKVLGEMAVQVAPKGALRLKPENTNAKSDHA